MSDLEINQESEKLSSEIRQIIKILLSAINDWPNQVVSLLAYEKIIYRLLGEEVDRNRIEEYISKIDYSKNAWEAESLSELIEVYRYYEERKPLKEIFKEIEEKIQDCDSADI